METTGNRIDIVEVAADDPLFPHVLRLAAAVLEQDRYLTSDIGHADESHVVAAWDSERCVGFLRFHIQQLGSDVGRAPAIHEGVPLREGYVDAFGVEPTMRRRGVGSKLQAFAIDYCRRAGCYQIRSRSPITSSENYSLKIEAGYTLHPSSENDSYYFLFAL